MITTHENRIKMGEATASHLEAAAVPASEWIAWPVNWSAISVGALASLAAIVLFGLIGTALGIHLAAPENRFVDLNKIGVATLIFSVFSAFFACVIGGWVAARIAGILRSEPAMLHGAITWLVAVPLVILLATLGAGTYFGGWYGGLAGSPSWATPAVAPYPRPEPLEPTASDAERAQYVVEYSEYRTKVRRWHEDTPRAVRNTALGAVTALLLGLIGGVIGGWMASGEPMSLTYYKTRANLTS